MTLGDDPIVAVRAGQSFYYDAVIDGDVNRSDWAAIANAALRSTPGVSGSVIGADASNIALKVTSTMDRARQRDIESDLTTALAAQPGVYAVKGSMLRLVSADAPNTPGAAPGGLNLSGLPTWAWVAVGLLLFTVVKK